MRPRARPDEPSDDRFDLGSGAPALVEGCIERDKGMGKPVPQKCLDNRDGDRHSTR